jgi:hypothetical protein
VLRQGMRAEGGAAAAQPLGASSPAGRPNRAGLEGATSGPLSVVDRPPLAERRGPGRRWTAPRRRRSSAHREEFPHGLSRSSRRRCFGRRRPASQGLQELEQITFGIRACCGCAPSPASAPSPPPPSSPPSMMPSASPTPISSKPTSAWCPQAQLGRDAAARRDHQGRPLTPPLAPDSGRRLDPPPPSATGGGPADLGLASPRAGQNRWPSSPSPVASPASSMRCCAIAVCSSPSAFGLRALPRLARPPP